MGCYFRRRLLGSNYRLSPLHCNFYWENIEESDVSVMLELGTRVQVTVQTPPSKPRPSKNDGGGVYCGKGSQENYCQKTSLSIFLLFAGAQWIGYQGLALCFLLLYRMSLGLVRFRFCPFLYCASDKEVTQGAERRRRIDW